MGFIVPAAARASVSGIAETGVGKGEGGVMLGAVA